VNQVVGCHQLRRADLADAHRANRRDAISIDNRTDANANTQNHENRSTALRIATPWGLSVDDRILSNPQPGFN
jgi:hypothetical protein